MRYVAERRNLDEAIEELRQIADGRNDILRAGHELVTSGHKVAQGRAMTRGGSEGRAEPPLR